VRWRAPRGGPGPGVQRVRVGLEPCGIARVVGELDDGKLQAQLETPALIAERGWSPAGPLVGQHGQADNLAIVAVEKAIVVDVHAAPELALGPALHLHVDEQERLPAAVFAHLDQLVGQAFADGRVAHGLLQLRVEELVPVAPVDAVVHRRKEQTQEIAEVALERLLPRPVEPAAVVHTDERTGRGCRRRSIRRASSGVARALVASCRLEVPRWES
jgi:hypothetical protein